MYNFKSYTTNLYSIGAMGETHMVYLLILYVNEQKMLPLYFADSQEEVDAFVAEFMR